MRMTTSTTVERQFERDASAPRIRVLIADDHPLILAGIRRMVERHDDIDVVGEAQSATQLLALIERRDPELVLMDLNMPGLSGPDCIAQIRETWPSVKVVVLSGCDDRPSIDAALCAGASAYIVKNANLIDVASVVRQTFTGAVFHAPLNAPRAESPASGDRDGSPMLTDRERSVLSAVGSGLTTTAISRDLWVSEHTVKFHLTNIYRKLGVSNRAGAVRYAVENDLVAA
jgi:DNA-binding NarL/FixJ family response regulator